MICAAVLLLAGCGDVPDDFLVDADYSFTELRVVENVTVTTEFAEYDGNVEMINYFVKNDTDDYFAWDDGPLQKMEKGEWRTVRHDSLVIGTQPVVDPHSTRTDTWQLEGKYPLPLPSGQYRIVLYYNEPFTREKFAAYAEFSVK